MKISHNHPIARHGLIVGEHLDHNGITYNVTDEYRDGFEVEPERLCAWRKCSKLF